MAVMCLTIALMISSWLVGDEGCVEIVSEIWHKPAKIRRRMSWLL